MKRIALLLVLGVVVFLHRLEPVHWTRLATQVFHSLHGPGFALLAVGVYLSLPSRSSDMRRLAVAFVVTLVIGILTELIQIPGGRRAELADIGMNAIGILAGLSAAAILSSSIRKKLGTTGLAGVSLIGLVAISIAFAPTMRATYAYAMQRMASPTLLSFEHEWELTYFGQNEHVDPQLIDAPRDWPAQGNTIASAQEHGNFGALLFLHPVADWTAYSALSFVAASANQDEHSIMVSIRQMRNKGEKQPDRYFRVLTISPVAQRYTFQFSDISNTAGHEQFNFALIESIVVSSATPGSDVSILIDDFRLH